MERYTNDLIHESSPYLQQHAHNPVNWLPWGEEALERAGREDKLILVSIGYSACHWCHVMEKECFEDEEVAALMNKFFVNIKVDREERPDVDHLYMTAVQLMTNRGGWPLNCFALPDGRPVYGGTYFPKEQWMNILRSLQSTFADNRKKAEEVADNLLKGIADAEFISDRRHVDGFDAEKLHELVLRWSMSFDREKGGPSRAPKFPMPNNLEFLLDYGLNRKDKSLLAHVETTLDKMAMGGIYDQVGGGFSRYSVDMLWKVPHFEKMLYDNGQLLSIYSKAYRYYKKMLYKHVVYQTVEWMKREMSDGSGGFYAALDADSEGEEGKYYIWTKEELKEELGEEYHWAEKIYGIDRNGYWEEGKYILLRTTSDTELIRATGLSEPALYDRITGLNERLLSVRCKRIRPGLDNKVLTGWNAMTLRGLCEAYKAFEDDEFRLLALRSAEFLLERCDKDGSVYRCLKAGSEKIPGFLEDHAHLIDAFLGVGEITGDEEWFERALKICEYTIADFRHENSGMFYFTGSDSELITRKMDLMDNVIPAGNSVMARNLFYLGRLYNRKDYLSAARQMLANVYEGMELYGSSFSNWAILLEHEAFDLYEIICTGPDREKMARELQSMPLPFSLIVFSKKGESRIPFMEGRSNEDTLLYVCVEGTCLAPVSSVTQVYDYVIQ